MPTRECLTPPDVPSYCCLGSISAGGAVFCNPQQCHLHVADCDIFDYTSRLISLECEIHNYDHAGIQVSTA
jgi:hypothetical protein